MKAAIVSLFGFLAIAAVGIISFCDGNSNVLCIESERKALLKFKQDLIDPSNRLSSWVNADQEDCCKWAGVFCNNLTGHVNELHLGGPDDPNMIINWPTLRGKINPSLLVLKHLSFLDLSDNDFGERHIPEFIGSLNSLTHLDLSSANFSKAIPHQLANLSKLQYLDLSFNSFGGVIPNGFQNMSSLSHLDLSWNSFTSSSIPTWLPNLNHLQFLALSATNLQGNISSVIGNLSSVTHLDLSSNSFTSSSIPTWLPNLNHLQFLDLSGTNLRGNISSVIGNLSSVTHLDLSDNNVDEAVSEIIESLSRCSLDRLESLSLRRSKLSGHLTDQLGQSKNLAFLDLSGNSISGPIPSPMGKLSSLTYLDLSGNSISGPIPSPMGKLSSLRYLDLSGNSISGPIPSPMGKLSSLRYLDLSKNSISGPIPFSIGKLSSLKELDVRYNKLNGSLPQSLGQLDNVEYLHISNNMLEGTVLEIHFSNLTRLRNLRASNNMLTFKPNASWTPPFKCEIIEMRNWNLGPQFPRWLQFQADLSDLDFSNTGISDVIPTWFWNISTQFEYVNLSHNQLVGEIPYWPKGFLVDLSSNRFTGLLPQVSPNLEYLFLSRNSFSGTLSHFLICNASTKLSISILDIGSNLLSGKLPDCWKHWNNLVALNLENNNLTGEIPRSLGSIRSLMSLNLRKNSLFGEVPSTLQHLASLMVLDLSENQLRGSISAWIGDKLSKLVVLNLRSNNFQSDVPEKICALLSLQVLDLGSNNVSGTIPKCFSNLSAITDKNLFHYGFLQMFLYSEEYILAMSESLFVKGREDAYSTTLGLVTSIDLSDNSLTGEIPKELGSLKALLSLNLSRNLLTGKIPENIGNMESLESLDLSINQLKGEIPPSLSHLTFLNHLNLSDNNLTGQIPTSTQLQSFEEFSYIGNHLCGPPVSKNCSANGVGTQKNVTNGGGNKGSKWSKVNGFYVSIVLGFVMGFWGVVTPLYFIRSWRFAYYQNLDHIGRKLYVLWATSARTSLS